MTVPPTNSPISAPKAMYMSTERNDDSATTDKVQQLVHEINEYKRNELQAWRNSIAAIYEYFITQRYKQETHQHIRN